MALEKISGKQEIFLSTTRTGIAVFAVNSKILVTGKFFFDDFSFFKKKRFLRFLAPMAPTASKKIVKNR